MLVSGRPGDAGIGALPLNADAAVLAAPLKARQTPPQPLAASCIAYLVPANGVVEVNGTTMSARDGAPIRDEAEIVLTAKEMRGWRSSRPQQDDMTVRAGRQCPTRAVVSWRRMPAPDPTCT